MMTDGSGYWRVIYVCLAAEKEDERKPLTLIRGLRLVKPCCKFYLAR